MNPISRIKIVDFSIPIPTRQLIFINECCGSGFWALKAYCKNLDEQKIKYQIKHVNYFNCYDSKLHETYGFQIDELKKYVYLVDLEENTVNKYDVEKPEQL